MSTVEEDRRWRERFSRLLEICSDEVKEKVGPQSLTRTAADPLQLADFSAKLKACDKEVSYEELQSALAWGESLVQLMGEALEAFRKLERQAVLRNLKNPKLAAEDRIKYLHGLDAEQVESLYRAVCAGFAKQPDLDDEITDGKAADEIADSEAVDKIADGEAADRLRTAAGRVRLTADCFALARNMQL